MNRIGRLKHWIKIFFNRSTKNFTQKKFVIKNKLSISDWRGKSIHYPASPKVSRLVPQPEKDREQNGKSIFSHLKRYTQISMQWLALLFLEEKPTIRGKFDCTMMFIACVSKIYCVLNNNAFKLFLIEHIGRYEYLTVSLVSHFKDVLFLPFIIWCFFNYTISPPHRNKRHFNRHFAFVYFLG